MWVQQQTYTELGLQRKHAHMDCCYCWLRPSGPMAARAMCVHIVVHHQSQSTSKLSSCFDPPSILLQRTAGSKPATSHASCCCCCCPMCFVLHSCGGSHVHYSKSSILFSSRADFPNLAKVVFTLLKILREHYLGVLYCQGILCLQMSVAALQSACFSTRHSAPASKCLGANFTLCEML